MHINCVVYLALLNDCGEKQDKRISGGEAETNAIEIQFMKLRINACPSELTNNEKRCIGWSNLQIKRENGGKLLD